MTDGRVSPLSDHDQTTVIGLLEARCSRSVRIVEVTPLGHRWAPVSRITFERSLPGIGRTAVVKTRRTEGAGHGGPAYLRREAAGLSAAAGSGAAPQLIGYDPLSGVVIQADVGDHPPLLDILVGNDPERAAQAMRAMAVSVARLHAGTLGTYGTRAAADGLGDWAAEALTGADVGSVVYAFGPPTWDAIEAVCNTLALPTAADARAEAVGVFERSLIQGERSVLTHRDLNPTNVLIMESDHREPQATLIDFEGCQFADRGVDIVFLLYPFPHHSNPWGTQPDAVGAAAERAYLDTLAELGADRLLDDHDTRVAEGAALTLVGRIARLATIASTDQSVQQSWRRRGQLVHQIQIFTRLAERAGTLLALRHWVGALAQAMITRWADATDPPPPLYPAYQSQ